MTLTEEALERLMESLIATEKHNQTAERHLPALCETPDLRALITEVERRRSDLYRQDALLEEARASLKQIEPFIPRSTATEGGAAARSSALKAADRVRAILTKLGETG